MLIEFDGLLLVSGKEIDLNALHAMLVEPFHLLLADDGAVHALLGTLGGIVPTAVGVVPNEGMNALLQGIGKKLFHAFATDVGLPTTVNQAILPSQVGSEVDEGYLVVIDDAWVLPDNP